MKGELPRATPARIRRDGTWGAWVEGSPRLGEEVLLVKRNGEKTREHVSEIIARPRAGETHSLVRLISARVYQPHGRQRKKTTASPKRRFAR